MQCNAKNQQQHSHALFLRRNHQSLVLSIKDNILSPKHDISVDLKIGTTITLHATKTSVGVNLGKGNSVTRDHSGVIWTHGDAKGWEDSVARVCEAAYLRIVGCTLNFGVVCVGNLGVDKEEGSAGVWEIG